MELAPNVVHPNGNVYDQVLLTGTTATVQADPKQITRVSFLDDNGDIVQVDFAGAGTLTITLESSSGPMLAASYNQPGVLYMKGHAVLEIQGSDATTNIAIVAVGSLSAQNQALFRAGALYDGIADIALLRIIANPVNPNGSTFGGIYCGNVHFWRTQGSTGIVAPNVQVQDAVNLHALTAIGDAVPELSFGAFSQFGIVNIAGGDLVQLNGRPIETSGYLFSVSMRSGRTSNNITLPVQIARAQLRYPDGRVATLPQIPPGTGIFP